jgi:phage tail sheath gpL-like
MATLNIVVTVNSADASQYTAAGQPNRCLGNAARLLDALASGSRPGSVSVQRSDTDPVAASATATLVSCATDTITIGSVTFTGTGTPTLSTHFETDGNDAADATALAAAINAHTTTNKIVVASASSNVVTVTCLQKGLVGNFIPFSETGSTITCTGSGFLAGGTGGGDGTVTTYGR